MSAGMTDNIPRKDRVARVIRQQARGEIDRHSIRTHKRHRGGRVIDRRPEERRGSRVGRGMADDADPGRRRRRERYGSVECDFDPLDPAAA